MIPSYISVPLHQVVEVTHHQPQLQQLKKRLKSKFTALSNICMYQHNLNLIFTGPRLHLLNLLLKVEM